MKHAWTGGQYSAWRASVGVVLLLAVASAFVEDASTPHAELALQVAAAGLCVALAIGFLDRGAALLLAIVWPIAMAGHAPSGSPEMWAIPVLLLVHASTRGSPFGSFDALGRADPGGSWILPDWNFAARWMLLGGVIAAGHAALWLPLAALVPLLLPRRALPFVWAAALALELYVGPLPWRLALLLAFLSTVDPGWIPPLSAKAPARVFYDEGCGLCARLVRFAIAEDRRGSALRFAPLQGETARSTFTGEERRRLPDSVVVRESDGRLLVRSRATQRILARLGGLWRGIAIGLGLVPAAILDLAYDAVAAVRHRLFPVPPDACPTMPPHLRRRFDP